MNSKKLRLSEKHGTQGPMVSEIDCLAPKSYERCVPVLVNNNGEEVYTMGSMGAPLPLVVGRGLSTSIHSSAPRGLKSTY